MERLWSRICGGAGLTGVLLFAALAFTPLVQVVGRSMAMATRDGQADAIVVLGASVSRDGVLDSPSLRRALAGIVALRAGRAPLLVFLGPRHGEAVEAEVRARLALQLGVERSDVLTEARGLTTRQEAERVKALLAARGLRRVALVTGEHHLQRAATLFRRMGLEVVPIGVQEIAGAPGRPDARLANARRLATEAAARLLYGTLGLT